MAKSVLDQVADKILEKSKYEAVLDSQWKEAIIEALAAAAAKVLFMKDLEEKGVVKRING